MNPRRLVTLRNTGAVVFAIFLVLHLATVATSLGGESAFNSALRATRTLYGHWWIELPLLTGLLAHLTGSLGLWWRRPAGMDRPWPAEVQTVAAFTLLLMLVGHIAFMRVMPALQGFVPDFAYIGTAFDIWPTLFVPYYIVLGAAGAYHLSFGLRVLARRRESGFTAAIHVAAAALFVAVGVNLPMIRYEAPSPEQLRNFLKPYETLTPWLLDMAEEHEFVRAYRAADAFQK